MKKKRLIILAVVWVFIIGVLTGYLLWANKQADHYAQVSRETENKQERILALEKANQLWPKTENISSLADLYISIGRSDLAEKIMVGRGDPQILNKLGNLYLTEDKLNEAEKAFTKAKSKKRNSDSLIGLILVELKYGDRGEAEAYLNELRRLDTSSANCYGTFVYLNDFKKSKNSFEKEKDCNLYGVSQFFGTYKATQNPLYLKLQAANLYFSQGFLKLAEEDILAILKEKDNYRDAHVLVSKVYEKMGDSTKANEHKQKAAEIDPVSVF